jgi:hygromycin-B 7''-O-kinase
MLPVVRTDQEWQAVVWDEQVVRPAAEDLAARLGLPGTGLRRYPGGSRPVYQVGGHRVLKLYPTISAPGSVTEARVLEYLHGQLPVATPELLACGEYENGWRYVLMSQLPGTELATAWPAIPARHQDRIAGQAGELLAALHGLDPGRVLLHTEVTRENLVASPGTWTLSGLLDFETAMAGDRPYEFVAAALSVAHGDPRLLGRLLDGYGHSFDPRELLAYALLHVHSNLRDSLSEFPVPPEPTLDSLALTWFSTT